MKILIIFLVVSTLLSCYRRPNKATGASGVIEGYWIPDNIKWLSPKSGDVSIDTIVRYANFRTLCFDNENRFYIFQSTQSFPKKYDSLIFESEPGISLYKGKWRFVDSGKIMLSYKLKKESFKLIIPIDTTKKLFFNGVIYKRTNLYDKQSKRKLDAYKGEWLP
ncbi:hypothetical protein [Mucilaginibacter ginsenosidivorax]|uniref:Uncharacterized protein n=1 Tax=Mucilaginibacter ginsenosidivorax TaxID=862126 RepID=A0A5B8W8U0_9SPHI|nr:hypothetical protein [Mucilaginibacter ginsenosidivorax]QEC79312.1 hypothetical protein FSB76_26425 [Mucilaginibacter ginsenosidivorax]